jgi:protein-tyrosine-phosphatase
MAEGLAKFLIGSNARIESAGLAPMLTGAAPEAIATLRQMYDVDISHHAPRSIAEIQLGLFEHVIVLDVHVFEALKNLYPSFAKKLTLWDIEDPFGQGMIAFRKTAEKITRMIENNLVPLFSG